MALFDVFNKKTVLVTGHSGFKGSWLSMWLKLLGARIVGVSNELPGYPNNYECCRLGEIVENHKIDIRDAKAIKKLVEKVSPDFIFHLAAQALVRPSYENPIETITTNSNGSANVLDSVRFCKKSTVLIMITSDKAYDNQEWEWGYRENDRIGGKDPYSASKGMAELIIRSYNESYFNTQNSNVSVGIARAGNVIGGGDWALDRIIPDCIKAWSENKVVEIRNPESTRPWQHVLEPLSGYLALGAKLYRNRNLHGDAYNFGPPAYQTQPVSELINEMAKYLGNVSWSNKTELNRQVYEAGLLKLNCDKALSDLNWVPTLQFKETVKLTAEWYRTYYQHAHARESMYQFSVEQIKKYTALAKERSISWAKDK